MKYVWISLFACAIGGGGWLLFQQTVHSQLRDRVQEKISERFAGTGLVANLGQARFLEGQGIQLSNLKIELESPNPASSSPEWSGTTWAKNSADESSNVEIYEAFIHAPASMTELASSELKVNAVELRRVRLTLVRNANGEWDFQNVLDSLAAFNPTPDSPIPVALTDCELRIIDRASTRTKPVSISNVDVFVQPIEHEGRPLIQISGGFQSPAISRIDFTTFLDQQTQRWQAKVTAKDATLSGELVSVLPKSIQSELAELQSVSGRINFVAQATGDMNLDEIPSFELAGDVAQLSIDDERLPIPLRNVAAKFGANNTGFVVSNATGKLGQAEFAGNYWQHGFIERGQWHCDGYVKRFNVDHSPRFSRWLPEYCKRFCQEYSPSGTTDVKFELTHDGTTLVHRKIDGTLTGMAFTWIKLPYKVENCVGTVNWLGDVCNFKVRSLTGKQEIEFKGVAKSLGKSPTYEINISVPGALPIDQKMRDAIEAKPKLASVLKAFSPSGHLAGIGTFKKLVAEGPVSRSFDIRLKQCSMEHDSFDYPIYNIFGLITVKNDDYTFSDLSGSNSSGKVSCNGTWNPINGLNVRFICNSVPLDDQLRFALKPSLREIWNGFRPRGTLDFIRIDMRLPIGQELDLTVEAAMNKPKDNTEANYISIHPIWFPYAINYLTGVVNIEAGKITLKDIEGKHQRTWMACQGDGRYDANSWSVKLKNLLVGSLKVDQDLLDAVPKTLAPPIRQLKFQGLLTVSGEITVAGKSAERSAPLATQTAFVQGGDFGSGGSSVVGSQPASSSMAWDLRFDMNQAKMQVGVPVENVSGGVKLVGIYDGENAECRGDLEIDSLTIYDAQITKIRGPIWLDNQQAAAGKFARFLTDNSSIKIGTENDKNPEFDSVSGLMHEGTVNFDAKLSSGSKNEYFVQATLNDGCLETACREFGSSLTDIEGHSFAAVRLAGDYSGIHSQRGDGIIQLRDAKIYELPVFLSLLKILNVRQVSRTAFDSSNIDFTIQGDQIHFGRMEFLGDAISLIGNGTMNLEREIDLNFYSVMGRNRFNIPVISDLYRASSQKILWINVDGSLDNPQTHRHVLSGLNDSLKQLFQPGDRTSIAERWQKGISSPADRMGPTYSTPSFSGQQEATDSGFNPSRTANRFRRPSNGSSIYNSGQPSNLQNSQNTILR